MPGLVRSPLQHLLDFHRCEQEPILLRSDPSANDWYHRNDESLSCRIIEFSFLQKKGVTTEISVAELVDIYPIQYIASCSLLNCYS